MKGLTLIFLLVIVAIVLVEFSECATRRSGSSSRSSGSRTRSSTSRTSRKSSSRRRRSSSHRSRTRRSFSPAGSPRVYKNTPIPIYASKSPVIIQQTKVGSRSNLARNAFVGYMFYRYGLRSSPVYRRRYPMHRSTVEIPDERAIRLNFTKEIMLDSNGTICLNSTKNYTIASDKNERVGAVFTSVRYSELNGGIPKEYRGDNETVSIDLNALDQSVEISTVVKYNGTIVVNTTCTQIKSVMNGTIVRMYATNPDADAGTVVKSSFLAVMLSSFFYLILHFY